MTEPTGKIERHFAVRYSALTAQYDVIARGGAGVGLPIAHSRDLLIAENFASRLNEAYQAAFEETSELYTIGLRGEL